MWTLCGLEQAIDATVYRRKSQISPIQPSFDVGLPGARRFIWASSDSFDRLPCEGRWFAAGDEPPGDGSDKG